MVFLRVKNEINVLLIICMLLIGIVSCVNISKNNITNESLEGIIMNDNVFIERQIAFMNDIVKMHDTVKNIHASLKNFTL
jgi:hypothetical protein